MFLKNIIKNNCYALYIAAFIYNCINFSLKRNLFRTNKIINKGAFLKNINIHIEGKYNYITIAPFSRLKNCKIYIKGDNCKITIGGGKTHITNTTLWCEDNNSSIIIGKDFTIESGHIASTEGCKIEIGDDCMFSNNIEIRNGDSHSIISLENQKRINQSCNIKIGNHIWLTAGVTVLKGVEIADDIVIGNKAIITKSLNEKNSIYAGIPAKLIKTNISWSREK